MLNLNDINDVNDVMSYLKQDLDKLEEIIPKAEDRRFFEKFLIYLNVPNSLKDPLITKKTTELIKIQYLEERCEMMSEMLYGEREDRKYENAHLTLQKQIIIHELKQLLRFDGLN